MNSLLDALLNLKSMDEVAMGDSPIHLLHPLLKLMGSFLMIVFVLTSYYLSELIFYVLCIFLISYLAKIPFIKVVKRSLIGLPLVFCLGLSYLLFNRQTIQFYHFYISEGLLLSILIVFKTFLTLSITYLLISTTTFDHLASELVHIKVPSIFVLQLTMTYRYIFTLLYEAKVMYTAYMLRNPKAKGIEMKDMGSFVGHLLVKSMNESSKIYDAMKCRGFNVLTSYKHYQKFETENIFILMMMLAVMIIVKVVAL